MSKLIIPVTKVDDTDDGDVQPVSGAAANVTLAFGYYKIVPMGTNLLWKTGPADVDATKGSYLADGDQEIIFIPADNTKLSWIRSANTTVDGQINIAVINLQEIPGQDPREYG